MRRDESRLDEAIKDAVELDRRTVNRAMAWSVPVVMAAVAAPATSGSQTPTPVMPQAVTLTPGTKGSVTIDFGTGDANVTVKVTSVSGGGATWTPETTGKDTTSTLTTTSKLTFAVTQNSSGTLTGIVTVQFSLSSGSNWQASFTYDNTKGTQTQAPATY